LLWFPISLFNSSVPSFEQNREKLTTETTEEERDRDTQKNENKEERLKEKKEKDLEPELEKETETKDDQVQVPVGRPDMIYGSPLPNPMRHLDTPSRKRLRRYMPQDNIPFLPPPNEEIVLKYFSSFPPIRKKEKETEMNSAKEEAINKVGGAFEFGGGIQTYLLHQMKS